MENKEEIIKFISNSPQGTIFTTPDWLEAVAPGRWEYLTLHSKDSLKICMPIILSNKMGFSFCNMPPFTQSLGILFPPQEGKYAEILTKNINYISELISKIPKNSYFRQRLHPSLTNWLPFHWEGYNQSTRYTYIIENLENREEIWKAFRSNIRQEIRKATKSIRVEQDDDFDSLKHCIKSTYARQKKKNFDFKTLKRIFKTCKKLKCGKIFLAKNKENEVCGAIFIVWDKNSAYYIAGGSPKEVRTTGAMPLLLWEAIQFSSDVTRKFNFEGSMIKSIEKFFRAFGGRQVPYLEITKTNSILIKLNQILFK